MTISDFQPGHVDGLTAMFQRLPDSDRTFIKEDVSATAVAGWPTGSRWVAMSDDGAVVGHASVVPLAGWSDHVAVLRLVVDPAERGRGTGRALTRHAVAAALRAGVLKVVLELPASQERTIEMFLGLGFTGEALLRDHFRDRDGRLRDLIMLAYLADQTFDALSAVGAADLLQEEAR